MPPRPAGEAARRLIRSTRVPFMQIVIHQTEEQVITNKGIQENTWEVVVGGGGGFQYGARAICGKAAVFRQDTERPLFYCFT